MTFKKNEPISASIHTIGLLFSIIGFVFLMFFTKENGTIFHFIGFMIFGISLIFTLCNQFLYIISFQNSVDTKRDCNAWII